MQLVWKFFAQFEFIGRLMELPVGGLTVYSVYIHALFAGFWAWLLWRAASAPRAAAAVFRTPAPWVALAAGAAFYFLSPTDLSDAYTYEVRNLADAAAAVSGGGVLRLLAQDRVVPIFFALALKLAGHKFLIAALCLFTGLFYAVWERILSDLGFRPAASAALALLTAWLQLTERYLFSAYFIFALLFSALFLREALRLARTGGGGRSFAELARPLPLILLAALFRQESLALFPVYAAALAAAGRPALKKGLAALAAAGVLYLPFVWHDWTHEEHQVTSPRWVQEDADLIYDASGGAAIGRLFYTNQLLANAAYTIRRGPLGRRMGRQEFSDAVKKVLFIPQPSLRNVWPNLKYRSPIFLAATLVWAAFAAAALLLRRRLGGDAPALAVLAVYILGVFFLFHTASLYIEIWVSHCHLIAAYAAFCALAARRLFASGAA